MQHNPYKLKEIDVDWKEKEKPPAGYLDTENFIKFLKRFLINKSRIIFIGLYPVCNP